MLGQIARAFHFRDRHVFVQLYTTYVMPHLEFAVQAWSPWTGADKAVLEQVQKQAIRMVSGLRSHEYAVLRSRSEPVLFGWSRSR